MLFVFSELLFSSAYYITGDISNYCITRDPGYMLKKRDTTAAPKKIQSSGAAFLTPLVCVQINHLGISLECKF